MIIFLVNLLVLFVFLSIVFAIARALVGYFGAPPVVMTILNCILALIALYFLLGFFGAYRGPHFYGPHNIFAT